jgi:peptidoglycan/LPS O-acetylase OafA/YrhL
VTPAALVPDDTIVRSESAAPALTHPKYRPDIDGLRAIAVLSVVVFHAFPGALPGGFVGVDVFFVISGFLISTIILGSLAKGTFSLREFYARRIKRIFPALLLVLVACYAFGWFTLFADEFKQVGKHLAGGAGFVSNILLWDEAGYFDTSAEVKPLLHLWSLGIEEQFYIAWPLILWLGWKCRINLLVLATVIAVASFAWNVRYVAGDASFVFYMPQTRAWELLVGAVTAYVRLHHLAPLGSSRLGDRALARFSKFVEPRAPVLCNSCSLVGAALLGYGLFAITPAKSFPGWWALLPTFGAVFIIFAGPKSWINRALGFRPLVWLGLVSFPLYLWHWPLLSFARIIQSTRPNPTMRCGAVLLSVLLATLTYRLLERPLRASQSRFKVGVLIAIMVFVGAAGLATFEANGLPKRRVVKDAEYFNSQFVGPHWKYATNDTCTRRYPFDEAKVYGWWFCITNKDDAPTLLLLGDSYANHLYPGLAREPSINGNTILSIGTCEVAAGYLVDHHKLVKEWRPCAGERAYHQRRFIDDIVEKSGTVRYAIIDGIDLDFDDAYAARVEKRVAFLEKNKIKVIMFVPHVEVHRDLKDCFARPLKSAVATCELPSSARKAIDSAFAPLAARISSAHPTVEFFDQNALFCDERRCSLLLDGMPIFRDDNAHYSEYASVALAKLFAVWAKTHAPDILTR